MEIGMLNFLDVINGHCTEGRISLYFIYLIIREALDIISTQLCNTRAAQEYRSHKKIGNL